MFGGLAELLKPDSLTTATMLARVLLSAAAGFILGFERKIHMQHAGLRTHILICISSTLMMLTSLYVPAVYSPASDSTRIAAQIVSGIGFLGGGAILRQGLNISGLNSAATIWVAAGVGMAIGCGMVLIAFLTVLLCIGIMLSLESFEAKYFPAKRVKHLVLVFENDKVNLNDLRRQLSDRGIIITNLDFSRDFDETHLRITYTVRVSDKLDIIGLTDSLKTFGSLEKVKMTD